MDNKKIIPALFLAPAAAPVTYFPLLFVIIALAPEEVVTHTAGLIFYGAYALPMGYFGSLIIGLPIVIVLISAKYLNPISLSTIGFIAGGVFYTFMVSSILHYSPSNTDLAWFLIPGGIMGVSVTSMFLVIAGITVPSKKRSD